MRTTKPKLSEADIQRAACELLIADGWRVLRTELTVQRERGRVVGERGMPDCLAVRYDGQKMYKHVSAMRCLGHEIMWLEFKAPGKPLKPMQLAWHAEELRQGALVLTVDDINGFVSWYLASGLNRSILNRSTTAI